MVKRKGVVEDSIVTNVIIANDDYMIEGKLLVDIPEGMPVAAGWHYASGLFTPVEEQPPEPPDEISDRQFAQALWKQEVITLEEAKAFVKIGEVPAALQALILALPEEQRDDVDLVISGATIFRRTHPVTEAIRLAFGWSETQRDDFWRFAASL